MTEFFQTRMGREFYDSTMPQIAQQLARLNDLLERLVTLLERREEGNTDA